MLSPARRVRLRLALTALVVPVVLVEEDMAEILGQTARRVNLRIPLGR
jgi:hypothetical protein